RSTGTATAAAPISPATALAASSRRSATATRAPSAAKRSAVWRPMPEPAPVTRQTLPARRPHPSPPAPPPLPLELFMVLEPPVGDVDPPREPDVAEAERVLDELSQRGGSAGLPRPAGVKTDRHHLRVARVPLPAKLVEAAPADVEEVRRPAEPLREDVAAVVVDHAVRHDEVALALHLGEVGEIVVVGVGVVDEAPLLHEQLARVHAGAVAAVPAERTLPGRLPEGLDRPLDVPALLLAVEQPVLLPAPPVAARLVTRLLQPLPNLRVSLEGDRRRVEGRLDAVLVEQAEEAPDARPATVLVDRLGAEVPVLGVHDVRDLGEALVAPVPGGLRVLRSLLLVDAEADDRLGVLRPEHLRRSASVADVLSLRAGDVLVDKSHLVTPFGFGSTGCRRCQSVSRW